MALTYEYVKESIRGRGDILLSSDYKNGRELLDIKCGKCEECYKMNFRNFEKRKTTGCYHINTKGKRLDYYNVKEIIESQPGYVLLSTEYKTSKELLDIKCGKCAEEYQQNIDRFQRGYHHPFCERDDKDPRPLSWITKERTYLHKICEQCKQQFTIPKGRDTQFLCSIECRKELEKQKALDGYYKKIGKIGGIASVKVQSRRSKNEIYFSELCEKEYGDILTNDAIFDGWDADVILPTLKVAVMWNGLWHYKQIRKNLDIEAAHIRDFKKIEAIKKCGYVPYIIVDMGKHNKKFVETQFEIFKQYVKTGEIYTKDHTIDHFNNIDSIENVRKLTSEDTKLEKIDNSIYNIIPTNIIRSNVKPKMLIIQI